MKSNRITSIAAALLLGATTAHAQQLATFGSAELAGYGEGSVLLGGSLNSGHPGWGWVADLIGQTYRFRDKGINNNSHAQAWAISPSAGVQYSMPTGAVQGLVGYTFVSSNEIAPNVGASPVVAGNPTGGTSSAFVSAQANYWGTGEHSAQWIGNYAFESEYYWTRLRLAQRIVSGAHPIYLGGEGIVQGSQKTDTFTSNGVTFKTPTESRWQVGPTIEYRVTPDFRVGASGGYRGGNNNFHGTGYARIEFLTLTHF